MSEPVSPAVAAAVRRERRSRALYEREVRWAARLAAAGVAPWLHGYWPPDHMRAVCEALAALARGHVLADGRTPAWSRVAGRPWTWRDLMRGARLVRARAALGGWR